MTNLTNSRSAFYTLMLFLGVIVVSQFAAPAKSQHVATLPPEVKMLLDRVAIEDMMVDYYAQIGTDKHDFSRFFTTEGRLEVNGLIAAGREEIIAMYDRVGGAIDETVSAGDNKVPPGVFNMVMSNLKVTVQGDTAVATMLWYSIVSPTLIAPPSVTEHGHDRTELVRQNGRWLIKRRVVTSDGGMPEGLLQSFLDRK